MRPLADSKMAGIGDDDIGSSLLWCALLIIILSKVRPTLLWFCYILNSIDVQKKLEIYDCWVCKIWFSSSMFLTSLVNTIMMGEGGGSIVSTITHYSRIYRINKSNSN